MRRLVCLTTIALVFFGYIVDSNTVDDQNADPKQLLYRKKPKQILGSDDWGANNTNKKNMRLMGKPKRPKNMFRSNAKSRGSGKSLTKVPASYPHERYKDDPLGCGNPLCVIIDLKPRRFHSICHFVKYLKNHGRKEQMNFIQKGDCYDLIDGEGANAKPWVSPDDKLQDCGSCKTNEYCNTHLTINIDLANMLYGKASSFGGPLYHPTSDGGERLVGIPAEFSSVCELMQYFQQRENLNVNTQIIGFAIGKKEELFPMNANSEKCLWTEWFDHDTPCNNDGDKEAHAEHFQRLQETETGPLRICKPQEIVGSTQYQGGSEITQVSAEDAKEGNGIGVTDQKFVQHLEFSNKELICKDTDQTIEKLPPPFIYGEGVKKNPKQNAGCLDYKARYCCKSNSMYRPQPVSDYEAQMPVQIPHGSMAGSVVLGGQGIKEANISIYSCFGVSDPSIVTLKCQEGSNTFTGDIKSNMKTYEVHGKYKKSDENQNQQVFNLRTGESDVFAKINIGYDQAGTVHSIKVDDNTEKVVCKSKVTNEGGKKYIETDISNGDQNLKVYADENGHKIKQEGKLDFTMTDETKVFDGLKRIFSELNVKYLIESPPVAHLFAECEWRDWVSLEYPDKRRTGQEWELRQATQKFGNVDKPKKAQKGKFSKHVCGKIPEAAMFVDAVAVENQIPWYEQKYDGRDYEVYKLTPYHGYVCNDANMLNNDKSPAKHCIDMKVRYCCVKKLRAQWSEWGQWSECSRSCGCGRQTRKKTCKDSKKRIKDSGLSAVAYDPTCVGEDSETLRKLLSEQSRQCNFEACPVDYSWSAWSQWSQCSVSCDSGQKERTRYCMPAIGEGEKCPDKREEENKDLYLEKQDCSEQDCERFAPTQWSSWSSCSVTCGMGSKMRNRHCMSEKTLQKVPGENCANEESYFTQNDKCKLKECPVDGNWGLWSEWSRCTQNCVHHPEAELVKTKAKRERKRHCVDPPPQFGGKKCQLDKNFMWLSHENAEMDEAECITRQNCGENCKEDEIVDWCPENCIITEWSEWSHCKVTCYPLGEEQLKFSGYDEKETKKSKKQAKLIQIQPCQPPIVDISRNRYRYMLKKERFGGICDYLNEDKFSYTDDRNESIIWQREDCKICKEHCPKKGPPEDNMMINWPEIPYPKPDDPSCIGYCPMSCRWKEIESKSDCCKFKEEFYTVEKLKKKGYTEEVAKMAAGSKCYPSHVLIILAEHGLPEEYKAYEQEIKGRLQETQEKGKWEGWGYRELKSLKSIFGDPEDDVREELGEGSQLKFAVMNDEENLKDLLENKDTREPHLPNLDGLFGGVSCQRVTDKKNMTIRDDSDPKFNKEVHHNQYLEERILRYDVCEIPQFCAFAITDVQPGETLVQPCVFFSWSAWGDWGQCTSPCHKNGHRERKRVCTNVCTEQVAATEEEKKKCRPFFNAYHNETVTDTDTAPCTPCPAYAVPQWSEWGQWARGGEGKYCGEGKQTFERKRVCVKAKPDSKIPCEGDAVETQLIDRPACIPDKKLCEECKIDGEKSHGQSHAKNLISAPLASLAPQTENFQVSQQPVARKLNGSPGGDDVANGSNEILEQQGEEDPEELYGDDGNASGAAPASFS